MHKTIAGLIAILCAASAAAIAADRVSAVPSAERTGFQRISAADLRADLTFLSSDALQGRMSLERGDEVAEQWIAAEFAKAGLEPIGAVIGGQKTFLQAVPLIEYRGDRDKSFLSLTRNGQVKQWQAPEVSGAFHDDVEVTAPVVFVGYGITAPGLGYDDYQGVDVNGKIVLMFEHEPQENDAQSRFNGTGNTRYATNRVKAMIAQKHGAVAVLVMGEPTRKHPSNAERIARIGGSITRLQPIPSQIIVGDEVRVPVATIGDTAAAELLANAGASAQDLQTAIDKDLSRQSRPLPDTTVTLHFANKSRVTGTTHNVVGLLPGSDPKLAAETIIISAHHDHDGSTPMASGSTEIFHGADDNGSGTVGVVELARAFSVNATKPKRSILFAVFAAEERGLLGAYYLAAHPLRPLATTRAMINFDMIGRDEAPSEQTNGLIDIPASTTNRLNLVGATYSPDYGATVMAANKAVGLDLDDRFDHDNALNVFFRSDQFPFVLHDVPAFWWFTGFHPDYHHSTDTADKIDYAKMARILQLSYLAAFRFADQPGYPKFVADPPGSH